MRMGVGRHYDNVTEKIKTTDLKIRVLDHTYESGEIHKLRILLGITDLDTGELFYTVGASREIYTAFLKAYIDAIEYKIIKNAEYLTSIG